MHILFSVMAFSAFTSIHSSAAQTLPVPEDLETIVQEPYRSKFKAPALPIPDLIFGAMENIRLFSIGNDSSLKTSISVERRVFDNHDTANSWSVFDQFHAKLRFPLYSFDSG